MFIDGVPLTSYVSKVLFLFFTGDVYLFYELYFPYEIILFLQLLLTEFFVSINRYDLIELRQSARDYVLGCSCYEGFYFYELLLFLSVKSPLSAELRRDCL